MAPWKRKRNNRIDLAVGYVKDGRGGSVEIHRRLRSEAVSQKRNDFPGSDSSDLITPLETRGIDYGAQLRSGGLR